MRGVGGAPLLNKDGRFCRFPSTTIPEDSRRATRAGLSFLRGCLRDAAAGAARAHARLDAAVRLLPYQDLTIHCAERHVCAAVGQDGEWSKGLDGTERRAAQVRVAGGSNEATSRTEGVSSTIERERLKCNNMGTWMTS